MAKNKKEKRETKSRLLLLVLLLVFSLSLCLVATYAWFTSNRIVSVDDLQVNVTAINGLEISADASDWKTRINKDDLIGSQNNNKNQLPSVLANVSSAGEVDPNGNLRVYYGSVVECSEGDTECLNDQYYLSAVAAKTFDNFCWDKKANNSSEGASKCSADTYLMAFDIYLKLDGEYSDKGALLSLTQNAGVTAIGSDYGIKNTARVAFVQEGYLTKAEYLDGVKASEEAEEVTPGVDAIGAMMKGTQSLIWEPNANAHTARGEKNAVKYGISDANAQSFLEYMGVKKAFSPEGETGVKVPLYHTNMDDPENPGTKKFAEYFATPENIIHSSAQHSSINLFELKPGVTKFRVYFWVEGQDVDTENFAAGTNMSLNLEFSIPEAA